MFDRSGRHGPRGARSGGRGFRGGPYGRGPHGPGGRLRRRLLTAADLQLVILALLEEKPRHGYEIIKAVQERSQGYYSPSAGMVYPALTYLTDLGYASVEAEGAKKHYSLTDTGRAFLSDNRQRSTAVLRELANLAERLERPGAARSIADAPAADDGDKLSAVYRDLKALLFDITQAGADERARVVEILKRAIAEIQSG